MNLNIFSMDVKTLLLVFIAVWSSLIPAVGDPHTDMRAERVDTDRAELTVVLVHISDSRYLQAAHNKDTTSVREEHLSRGVLDLEVRILSVNHSGPEQSPALSWRSTALSLSVWTSWDFSVTDKRRSSRVTSLPRCRMWDCFTHTDNHELKLKFIFKIILSYFKINITLILSEK